MIMLVVAPLRFAFVVDDYTLRGINDLKAFSADSKTQIKILEPVGKGFIESTKGSEYFARKKHARGCNSLEFSLSVDCWMAGAEISVYMMDKCCAECDTCMLNGFVWIKKFASDDPNMFLTFNAIDKLFNPSIRYLGVVI